jgi:hypothetical protein
MMTIVLLPVVGDDPLFGACGIDATGATYFHPGMIGRACLEKSAKAGVKIYLPWQAGLVLPLVPIKWGQKHFKRYRKALHEIDREIRRLSASNSGLN